METTSNVQPYPAVRELVSSGLTGAWRNYGGFFSLTTAMFAAVILPNALLMTGSPGEAVSSLLSILAILATSLFATLFTRFSLGIVDNDPAIKAFSYPKGCFRVALANIIMSFAAFLPFYLVLVFALPRGTGALPLAAATLGFLIFLAVAYPQVMFMNYFIVGYDNTVMESARNSWMATRGLKGRTILTFLALALVMVFLSVPFSVPLLISSGSLYLSIAQTGKIPENPSEFALFWSAVSLPLMIIIMPFLYGFYAIAAGKLFRELTDIEVPDGETESSGNGTTSGDTPGKNDGIYV